MLSHGSEVSHVFGQQQEVFHSISNIPSCALLEILDESVAKKRSFI